MPKWKRADGIISSGMADLLIKGILAIATLSGGILAWVKWWKPKGIEHSEIYKAMEGNHQIDVILEDVRQRISNTVKVGIIETTNGGGIPTVGHLTYKKVIACTDSTVLRLFGEKTPNDQSYNDIIWQTLKNGEHTWWTDEMRDPAVVDLFKSTNITGGIVYLIGIEKGVRLLAIAVDFRDFYEPTPTERYMIREAKAQIGRIIKGKNKNVELL